MIFKESCRRNVNIQFAYISYIFYYIIITFSENVKQLQNFLRFFMEN